MLMLKLVGHGRGVQPFVVAAISRTALAAAYIMSSGLTASQSGPGPAGSISYTYAYAMPLQQAVQYFTVIWHPLEPGIVTVVVPEFHPAHPAGRAGADEQSARAVVLPNMPLQQSNAIADKATIFEIKCFIKCVLSKN